MHNPVHTFYENSYRSAGFGAQHFEYAMVKGRYKG